MSNKIFIATNNKEKLKEFGPCPEHRMSFLGKILGGKK